MVAVPQGTLPCGERNLEELQPERIETIINFEAIAKYGIKAEGNDEAASAAILAELDRLADQEELEIPIAGVDAGVCPLAAVREAYRELEQRHALGRIVLVP